MTTTTPRIPVRALIPNAITALAFCAGLTAIHAAVNAHWEMAAWSLAIAGILDGLDGRVARMVRGTSRFGAELDSLADVVSFGAAPALIVTLWALQSYPRLGWLAAMSYALCCALRLARYNSHLDEEASAAKSFGYFTGVPAPGGAAIVLLPLYLSLAWPQYSAWLHQPLLLIGLLFSAALLMISEIPIMGWAALHIRPAWRMPALVAFALLFAGLFMEPWVVFSLLISSYIFCIPLGYIAYRRRVRG
jgi:CDP-diacylglycerol---serine O-phosphatidyltransferase